MTQQDINDRQYDQLIEGIREVMVEAAGEQGRIQAGVILGALGYHLDCVFDRYPPASRDAAIEHFIDVLRQSFRDTAH